MCALSVPPMDESPRHDRFRAIYDSNYSPILGYALRRTATAEDAADVVAETFLAAWRRLDDMPAGGEARLWLYGVARRVLANQLRGDRRRERLEARLRREPAPLLEAPGGMDAGTDLEHVCIAFERLRDQDREVLALVAWEGLGPREISPVLACSPTAARIRLHRARRRFARELARAGISPKRSHATGQVDGRQLIDSLGTEDVL
jgi:RNA polymerase sigma-70 factor (ECF subfamily)